MKTEFEWDEHKNAINIEKHGVSFYRAQHAFADASRIIAEDTQHSKGEQRYYCYGFVDQGIMTVRFTHRNGKIRIIGSGYWRKGKETYEKENRL